MADLNPVEFGATGARGDLRAALEHIGRRDPDAGSVQPTPQMYREHKQWAQQRYGKDVWKTYKGHNWGGHSEV